MISALESRIDVVLTRENARVVSVSISSSRPQLAQRLLVGHTPEKAVELAGLMFSLCGKAQHTAAQAACDAALDVVPDDALRQARERAVLIELALEHAWRLLLDWPTQAGGRHSPDIETLLSLRKNSANGYLFTETLGNLLMNQMLGESPQAWLDRDFNGFMSWMESGKTMLARLFADLPDGSDIGISLVSLLPALQDIDRGFLDKVACAALINPDFCMLPNINGDVAETGAVSRAQHHPILFEWIAKKGRGVGARMLARLLELAQVVGMLKSEIMPMVRTINMNKQIGVAAVETSRGLLIHVVRLVDVKVADYRIIAPTEWNFHPQGTLAQSLTALEAGEHLGRHAQLVCQSLDPCVGYVVEINNA
jgi:coenzyme F420-reducing hydrogenase alpha subunit